MNRLKFVIRHSSFVIAALALLATATAQQTPLKNGLLTGTLNGTPSSGTLNLSGLTMTLPSTYVTLTGTQTLTGKTLNGNNNTISNTTHRALFCDQKATGANGDAVTFGGWRTVTLNTEVYDTSAGFSVASNVITVGATGAGSRFVHATVPLYGTSSSRVRLRRTNNTPATLAVGSVEYTWNSNYVTSKSEIHAQVTLTAGDTLELQVFTQTSGNIGYNSDASSGEASVFSKIEFFTR